MQEKIRCRISPTLGGGFDGTPSEVWGTIEYNPATDQDKPCVFFGMYGNPDFYTLWRHKGKKWILWCGTDVTHFCNGYWLDYKGEIRLDPRSLAQWINKNCESWCENEVEQRALKAHGIDSQVCPSFLGNVKKYPITYKQSDMPKVYISVSGDNFEQYGWPLIEKIADKTPRVSYYLYGNKSEWKTKHKNVIIRGRISPEVMNEEIKLMQAGLRFTKEMDGASEIMVKSGLWGQWPIVYRAYSYPFVSSFAHEDELIHLLTSLRYRESPNTKFRDWLLTNLNKYPFNENT
mgnify:CR=1 FL=1